MACKDLLTSEAKAKSWLRTLGSIDKDLNITNLSKFQANVKELSKHVVEKYSITEPLFAKKGKKAIPNITAFHEIDAKKNIWYKENEYLKSVNEQNQDIVAETKPIQVLDTKLHDELIKIEKAYLADSVRLDYTGYINKDEIDVYQDKVKQHNISDSFTRYELKQVPNQDLYFLKKSFTSSYLYKDEPMAIKDAVKLTDQSQINNCLL